jgi:hypothetical protein
MEGSGWTQEKRQLGRPRLRWQYTIQIGRRETGQGGIDCINLAQDGDNWRAPVKTRIGRLDSIIFQEILEQLSD